MKHSTGGLLIGGPYDGELVDTEQPVTRIYAMTHIPDFGIEWHRYEHEPNLMCSAEIMRPVFTHQGVEYGESGLTPSNHPWFTKGSEHWRRFAQSGRRLLTFAMEH